MASDSEMAKEADKQEDELIERAELLFEHQKKQYEIASEGVRRLEDKAMKTFSAISVIITIALLVVRNWWADIFPEKSGLSHVVCWMFLVFFLSMFFISWGFTFSAMQLQDVERPASDADSLESFYMHQKRYNTLAAYAREYARLTDVVDLVHLSKAKLIRNCFEAMHFGAWSFVFFLITLVIIKFNN
ncbi:hypothetical protein UXP00_03395 [Enterobacter asburiae]|uniref:hypothetical protein n=1 Tax=Enterobacter asburiae TaxID=61645 RepID=UPI002FD33995